jgi:hypothetical protein
MEAASVLPDQEDEPEGRTLIHSLIEHAECCDAMNDRGGIELAITRARYIQDELARRTQNRQTGWIIAMTAAITIMTLVVTVGTVSPEAVKSVWH